MSANVWSYAYRMYEKIISKTYFPIANVPHTHTNGLENVRETKKSRAYAKERLLQIHIYIKCFLVFRNFNRRTCHRRVRRLTYPAIVEKQSQENSEGNETSRDDIVRISAVTTQSRHDFGGDDENAESGYYFFFFFVIPLLFSTERKSNIRGKKKKLF